MVLIGNKFNILDSYWYLYKCTINYISTLFVAWVFMRHIIYLKILQFFHKKSDSPLQISDSAILPPSSRAISLPTIPKFWEPTIINFSDTLVNIDTKVLQMIFISFLFKTKSLTIAQKVSRTNFFVLLSLKGHGYEFCQNLFFWSKYLQCFRKAFLVCIKFKCHF